MAVIQKLKDFFSRLTPIELIAIAVGLLIAFAVVTYGGERFGAWRTNRSFEKERKERLEQVQKALALAEAKTKEAEKKEAKAQALGEANELKAKDAEVKEQQIEQQDLEAMDAIEREYQDAKARIAGDMSECDRLRDACATAGRLGLELDACNPITIINACQ